ncbi:39S ribosomal protein L9, mitochondrial isoform X1 [Esox lucius]|uniref:39S ribosomal protein L9, mitochondrial isoform X1 n=1 Tax=Esox lucius TaxID=8010 RepID=UPI00147749A7|nr:39S ribosomal protein L9, mitochondrial isoform X1 [Esox lucius]
MWSTSHHVLRDVVRELTKLTHSSVRCFSKTSCKNTVVVERWWQVPLSKEGRPPRLYPRRHQVYKVVEDTKNAPKEKLELILTQTVPKLGGRGDTVFVKKNVGRNKLLAKDLAVYPSPENKEMFAEELRLLREGKPEERTQTRTGQLTVEFLKHMEMKVEKKPSEYDITKEIVCRQFLTKRGVFVPPHALKLSEEPIKDLGDYWCEVTVNGIDTVRIPMSVVPFVDPRARRKKQDNDSVTKAAVPEASISETPVTVAAGAVVSEVVVPAETVPLPLVESREETMEKEAFPPTDNQKKEKD